MDERPYPEGIDVLWLASDQAGHLGVFVTGGRGPIPAQALLETYPLDTIEDQILKLPKASDIDLRIRDPRPIASSPWPSEDSSCSTGATSIAPKPTSTNMS